MAKRRLSFDFHPEAMIEAREATDWYAARSHDVPIAFKAELRRAEDLVTATPQSWATYLHGTRRFKLDRFPYALVYVERGDRVIGIAVAHLKRRPGYWRKRLKD
jgi:plasmid stabilization system protein ParE